jgi:uncharacterized membrane protein YeaQ/YmgE (transglycosylase-associated protein family)
MNFDIGAIISWLILGLVTGYVVHMIDRRDVRGGILATLITGLIGAFLGGILSSLFFGVGVTGFNFTSLVIATVGGLIFSVVQRMATSDKKDEAIPQLGADQRSTYQPAYYSDITPLNTAEEERGRRKNPSPVKKQEREGKLVNPIQVEKFLKEVDFPADKEELIKVAIDNGADDNVIYTLEHLSDKAYDDPTMVSKELGKIE